MTSQTNLFDMPQWTKKNDLQHIRYQLEKLGIKTAEMTPQELITYIKPLKDYRKYGFFMPPIPKSLC